MKTVVNKRRPKTLSVQRVDFCNDSCMREAGGDPVVAASMDPRSNSVVMRFNLA